MTYDYLLKLIQDKEPFSFSRFGDGEIACMLQTKPGKANCDQHPYHPDLGKRLYSILESSPDYLLGLQSLGYRQNKVAIDAITEAFNIEWTEANLIHRENGKNGLQSLFEVLDERQVLLVGAKHLKRLYPDHLRNFHLVEIPSKDCWKDYERIKTELKALLPLEIFKDAVVVYCASMMSNCLIDDFHGIAHTQIDVGSAFDPYCGIHSRSYHKTMKI